MNENKVNKTIAKNFNKNPEVKDNKEIQKPFEDFSNAENENVETKMKNQQVFTTNVTSFNPDFIEIPSNEDKENKENNENLNTNTNVKTENSPIDIEVEIENNNQKKFTDVDLKIIEEVKK